jgi:hypothetical protein
MAPWLCFWRTQKSVGAKSKGLCFYCYNYFAKLKCNERVPRECKNQWELMGVHKGGR